MTLPVSYQGIAFNEVPESENAIHGDDVAAQYGFEGGLVPGVTVSAYLAHPAVEAWGLAYVSCGAARLVIEKPVYDGRPFSVDVTADGKHAYDAILTDQAGAVRARGRCWIPEQLPDPPRRRGDPEVSPKMTRPFGTPQTMRRLQETGLGALRIRWSDDAELTTYFKDAGLMPAPLVAAGGRHAHLGFVLGLTNWVLGGNVQIGPWLHLQTESQCFSAIEWGEELIVESAIADLFEKKGHHFCDVDVCVFRSKNDAPVVSARLRAIYQLRGV
jgi:hypothetical protein